MLQHAGQLTILVSQIQWCKGVEDAVLRRDMQASKASKLSSKASKLSQASKLRRRGRCASSGYAGARASSKASKLMQALSSKACKLMQARERQAQFACFTSTKVQMLTRRLCLVLQIC